MGLADGSSIGLLPERPGVLPEVPGLIPEVPGWVSHGGAETRRAAAALDVQVTALRRAGGTLRALLADPASTLGWRGAGATSAEAAARGTVDRLTSAAVRLEQARDALAVLGAALDAQEDLLAGAAWARADPPGRALLRQRWRTAVLALGATDTAAAEILRTVAAGLAGLTRRTRRTRPTRVTRVTRPEAPAVRDPDRSPWDALADGAGDVCRGAVDGLASFANAVGQHPESVAQLAAGLLLVEFGVAGETLGVAADLTGVGAVIGVPAGVVSAAAVAGGVALSASAVGRLGAQAAGDDHVALMDSGRPGLDVSGARYAQRTASQRFSVRGRFRGRLVDDVAADLRAGRIGVDDVPIDAIRRGGNVFLLNTRSSLALEKAGIPRSRWRVMDRTGERGYERRLSGQLARNRLGSRGLRSVEVDEWE
ncbi:MAG: hypothetical protein QG622_3137 [Actinomycetota bacterium]|nr:hypothetical protein [Actinomycetota bacterium]